MMEIDTYQTQAARTIRSMSSTDMMMHSLHEMASEVGELHGIYQKAYQGHAVDPVHVKKELGDVLWGIAEFCTSQGWNMSEVAQMNIDKLRARYPEGFSEACSINRAEGDV